MYTYNLHCISVCCHILGLQSIQALLLLQSCNIIWNVCIIKMLILFFKRFSGTVSSSLTFVWKVWEQGGGSFSLPLSLIYSLHSLVQSLLSSWVLSGPFLKVSFLFTWSVFVVFISPHPLGCISVPPFLAPHGTLCLGVEEGGDLKNADRL